MPSRVPAIEVVRVRSWDADLGVDVSRVVGYRAPCPECGFGDKWPTVRAARSERVKHLRAEHGRT